MDSEAAAAVPAAAEPRGAGDMNLRRLFKHLLMPPWLAGRAFSAGVLQRIEDAVTASEGRHRGELCVAIEPSLDLMPLLRGQSPRARAEELFSQLRVWDTAENSGVLLYVNYADHDIEIVADRSIAAKVTQAQWEDICHGIEAHFRAGRFEQGMLEAVQAVADLLALHFPAAVGNPNELSDRPILL